MFGFRRPGPPEWLIVFLGNPGKKYEGTRHNIGWMVCDALSAQHSAPVQRLRFRALTGTAKLGGTNVLLMKPTTYMNLSGEAVAEAARFYKLPPAHILVVSDETALPPGKLRLRTGGSAGGHNGLKSIIAHLGGDQFPRLRVGVGGKPHPDYDMADWVLGTFAPGDRPAINAAVIRAAEAVACVVQHGVDDAMAKYNG